MTWIPPLLLSAALIALAAVTGVYLRRASRARRELSQRLHDAALALDRRCDVLQDQILALDRRQRIDHLESLVDRGEAEGRLPARVTPDLRRCLADLRAECFCPRSSPEARQP